MKKKQYSTLDALEVQHLGKLHSFRVTSGK